MNKENNHKVRILGAGLSGLTAAINLGKKGYNVEVFEKQPDCGMRFHGDLQGLENWTEKKGVLQSLKQMGIETNFKVTPFASVTFSNIQESKNFDFKKPLFYLVKRGTDKDSLDQALKNQALKLGVKINFNQTIKESEADIIATGPKHKKLSVADKGIVFKTDLPNMASVVVSDKAALNGYSYLLIVDGYACMCSCVFGDTKQLNNCFEFTKEYFSKKYNLDTSNSKHVGGIGYFGVNNAYKIGNSLIVGEAAGIQDFLAGFGMRSAITSGFLAAQAIIKGKDYEKMVKKKYDRYLKAGIVNRYAWEKAKNRDYIGAFERLNKLSKSTHFLRMIYNSNFITRRKYSSALAYIQENYPSITQ